jgi:hypothetical protein
MSYSAIYDVSKALQTLLYNQAHELNTSVVVTSLPPGDKLSGTGLNLYLYRVVESAYTRNQPWPGDRSPNSLPSDRPPLGLMLYYLLTPLSATSSGDGGFSAGDDAHTMLGLAMQVLQEHPVLNDIHLPAVGNNLGFDSDLELPAYILDSYERVQITLVPMSLDEISRIWATINQPYRLSVVYEASLVELTPTTPPPRGGGIVTSTGVRVITLDPPRLLGLSPAIGSLGTLAVGALTANTLTLSGFGFTFPGRTTRVTFAGADVPIVGTPKDTRIVVQLPLEVPGGPQVDVRVIVNRASTPLAFTISPWLSDISPIRTALDPSHGLADSQLTLRGSGFGVAVQPTIRFDGDPLAGPVTANAAAQFEDIEATVTIPAALAQQNGIYNVRLVDGAGSVSNSRTLTVIPLLTSLTHGVTQITPGGGTPINVSQVTIAGARLAGTDMRITLDGVDYQAGKNTTANQFTYTFSRVLDSGSYTLGVTVDGYRSRDGQLAVP